MTTGSSCGTNTAAAEMLGYHADELLRLNVSDLQSAEPPDSLTRYQEYLATGFRAGEWAFLRRDGEQRTARYTMTKYATGLHLCIVRDVTDTKRAKEALRQSESRYRQMFEQNRAVQVLVDPATGEIVSANPAAAEYYGYTLDQLRKMTIMEVATQSSAETARRLQQTAEGEGYYFVSRHRLASGEIRDVEVHSSPLHLAERTLLYSIINDVSERQRNEERFRRFFELPLVGIAVTSPERRFLQTNQKLCDMLGYSEEEMTNLEWTTVTHADDIEENIALLEQTLRGETDGYRMEKRFLHRDGHVVYASISSRCVRRDDGSVDYLVLIVEDISERRQAELALRDSEERFRQLAENIDAVFFMSEGVDRVEPQRVIYVSPAYEKIWGLSRERLYRQQRSWFEGVHPEDRERIAASFPKIAIGEFDEEFRVVRPDGDIRWVHDRVFPIHDEQGQVYRIAGIVEDITDRKIAEERLRHSEAKFSGIVSIAADAILSIDDQSRITLFNEGAEKIFGYSRNEVLGEKMDILVPEGVRHMHRRHINDFAKDLLLRGEWESVRRSLPGVRMERNFQQKRRYPSSIWATNEF
jgi:PAS domain S-box-containing protein